MVIIDGMPASKPQIATYPRKGTETKHLCNKRQGIALQFIPARGRKQLFDEPLVFAVHCNLSPQGDGNDGLNVGIVKNMFIAIYPRKGTETMDLMSELSKTCLLQFIPARGQKSTSATGVCQQRRCFAFSYILFYRLGAAPAGIVFVTGSALMPCGTFRFRGRISCR